MNAFPLPLQNHYPAISTLFHAPVTDLEGLLDSFWVQSQGASEGHLRTEDREVETLILLAFLCLGMSLHCFH
jgi:hypothetical protein